MASFTATTPAVPSLRLSLQCNLGIHYLLALTAPAFAVSGRFQPFLESRGCSLLSSACLIKHRSVDCAVLWVFAGVHKKHQTHNHKRPSRGNKCLGNLCREKGVAW